MKETDELYYQIINNKEHWIKLDGGLSNQVFLYDNKYVIKIFDKNNNNLFVILENYYKILKDLETTLYLDKQNGYLIEKFVEGNIVDNATLFTKNFCLKIFNLIDKKIYNIIPDICKKNVILEYINYLNKYIETNKIFQDEINFVKHIFLPNINLEENEELKFSHNDIQKYNLIIKDNDINLIDWEYSGYTWKYFDHCNFIVLLINEMITGKMYDLDKIDDLIDLQYFLEIMILIYKKEKKYFLNQMLISGYTWYLWSLVKYDKTKDKLYIDYGNQIFIIIKYLCSKL